MARDRTLLTGTAAAVIAASLFGTLGPLSRFAADLGVEGIAFTGWRAFLGAVALAIGVVARGNLFAAWSSIASLDARGRVALAVVAVAGLALNASMFTAFGRIPIALALMLFYTYPAGVALVDVLLGREPASAVRVGALALASVGVVLVLVGGVDLGAAGPIDPLGVVLALAAAASQVVFISVSRNGYRGVPADAATVVILAVSVAGALPLALLVGQAGGVLAPLRSPEPWPILLFSGVVAAGITSLLFLTAIRRIGGTRTGILMLVEPVVGVTLAGLWLGEALGPAQALGGALVLGGAIVLQLSSAPTHEPITEEGASPVV